MNGFVDEVIIEVSSGSGGPGSVHFRREKYVPRGGPDGGDGGDGGDAVFIVQRHLKTLSHLKMKGVWRAENGQPGTGKKRHGRNGSDVLIPVPPGTLVKDPGTGRILKDFSRDDEEVWVFLRGGKGGQGNTHFATSTRQAPRYAQPGLPGQTESVQVELNIIADVGLVGLPNAGKSTLLSVLTNAHPKIGNYPFTTRVPSVGVLRRNDQDVILADIPGIIEGAARGAGLGLRFLRHISRTRMLLFCIDLSDPAFREAVPVLEGELRTYSEELAGRPRLLLGTKLDLEEAGEHLDELRREHPGDRVLGVSALTRTGLPELSNLLLEVAGRRA